MEKKKFQLVCGAKYKKAATIIAIIAIMALVVFTLLKAPGADEETTVSPFAGATRVEVTSTPEPTATPVAELVQPENNQFSGDVEEIYTPLQGSTPSSDGVAIQREEIVGTEEFQQSHEGETAVDNSNQEIGWVENSTLPQQEVVEVSIPEVLTPTPQPTTTPVVDETVSSEPAEPTVQEEQQAPEASAPVVEETQEEAQPEPTPESIPDAQPETDITIDVETGEVSGEEATPQGEDLCGPAYGYEEGLFYFDGQGCVFKG